MASTYLPRPDGAFNAWQQQFAVILSQNLGFWPVDGALTGAYFDALAAWNAAFGAHEAARAAAQAATTAKDEARERLDAAVRPLVRQLQGLLEVTDPDRRNLGITVRQPGGAPAAAPTTTPRVRVATTARLTHTVRISDESTPTLTRKPRGTLGAEVWLATVPAGSPPPKDPAAYTFLSLATRPTLTTEFPAEQGGKTAVYLLRWLGTRGDRGPWSTPALATVAA